MQISYQPAASLVGQAGYQSGLGDYSRYAQNLNLQKNAQQLSNVENLRNLAQNTYQTQYGGALQQNLQQNQIGNQQLMQSRDIASSQYMQEQGFENSNLQQLRSIGSSLYQQQVDFAGRASLAAQQNTYGQQSQILAGTIHSSLAAQNAMYDMGMSSTRFDQTALLQSAQAQNQIAINRAGLQNQLDFMPQISEAEFQSQQTKFASQMSALDGAFNGGQVNQEEYDNARQQLLGNMLGLQRQMPSRSDAFTQYQKMTFTPYTDQIDPQTGQPIPQFDPQGNPITVPRDPITGQAYRYQINQRTGEVSLDPAQQANIQLYHYGAAIKQRQQADSANQQIQVTEMVVRAASDAVKAGVFSDYNTAFATIQNQVMSTLKAGRNPQVAM